MLTSLNTGVSGMRSAQERINLIGDNIANVNTTGFKAARMTFQDSFSVTLRDAISSGPAGGARSGVQIGSGVSTAGTSYLFGQGQLAQTEATTDLYISGNGFFVVKDADGSEYATRAGDFHIDSTSGYLVTNTGQRVQGYADPAGTQLGDVRIDDQEGRPATSDPEAVLDRVNIRPNGEVWITLSDHTSFRRSQVLLQNFRNPQALQRIGNNLYTGLQQAGREPIAAPQSNGLGTLQAGALELSNVDLAGEFASLIVTQRAFQANARMITSSDELLQEMVNLKR